MRTAEYQLAVKESSPDLQYAAIPEASKCGVGLIQTERSNLCSDARPGCELEKFLTIKPGKIGDGSHCALHPQD